MRTQTSSHPIFSKATRATSCRSPAARKPRYCPPLDPTTQGQLHAAKGGITVLTTSLYPSCFLRKLTRYSALKQARVQSQSCASWGPWEFCHWFYRPGSRRHRVVLKQPLWNRSPRLQLVLIYSGWLQFNTDQYRSGCHNSSLRFASKGSNSFDLPNRENWRAYN